MELDDRACYRAVLARDARFDGRFFTCVRTTGIYCRPICPARPPKMENCWFVRTAAAAQEAGYRACLRCRPESSPELDGWKGSSAVVARGLKMIEAGALDDGDVGSLAARLEIGERQLRRLFRKHMGAGPVSVAQTRRVLLAKQLIHQTKLSMIDVAMGSGFGSVRRFNETFGRLYGRPPRELRRQGGEEGKLGSEAGISLLLAYHPPYDWEGMMRFLGARAIEGVEVVANGMYSRVIELGDSVGTIQVGHVPERTSLRVEVRFGRLDALPVIIARIRRMFDLRAEPEAIGAALSNDSMLARLVAARPGLRVPGGWDAFEVGVRAVLGQQVTLKMGVRLAGRVVKALGREAGEEAGGKSELTHAFPGAERFEGRSLEGLGITGNRRETLARLAAEARNDPRLFDPRASLELAVGRLREVAGIGEWSAQYIAMRGMGESDAFLTGDAAVRRRFAMGGRQWSAAEIWKRAERWRPWRAYAMLHLWMAETDRSAAKREASFKENRNAINDAVMA